MSALQIRELNRQAKLESNTELNENKKVYAMYKPMTHFAKVTTDENLVRILTECNDYRIEAVYVNGEQVA